MKNIQKIAIVCAVFLFNGFAPLEARAECQTAAECAQEAVETAAKTKALLDVLIPKGTIMAFNLNSCPTGWTNFTASNGRFLRGIVPGGDRVAGSLQDDAIQFHEHGIEDVQSVAHAPGTKVDQGYQKGPYGHNVRSTGQISSGNTKTDANETRPKNVAVLFCTRD